MDAVRLLILLAAISFVIGMIYTVWRYENQFQDQLKEDDR